MISSIAKGKSVTINLSYECTGTIDKSTCFDLKIKRKGKSINISKSMLQNLRGKFDSIDWEIDKIFKKKFEGMK